MRIIHSFPTSLSRGCMCYHARIVCGAFSSEVARNCHDHASRLSTRLISSVRRVASALPHACGPDSGIAGGPRWCQRPRRQRPRTRRQPRPARRDARSAGGRARSGASRPRRSHCRRAPRPGASATCRASVACRCAFSPHQRQTSPAANATQVRYERLRLDVTAVLGHGVAEAAVSLEAG